MITAKQAQDLLNLPKHIVEGEEYLDKKEYALKFPIKIRIYMASKTNDDFIFFLEIWQSSKQQIKITLHFQEEDSNIGLLRVDFNSRHKNPEIINTNVPDIFKPYAGKWIEENHIHYFVDGYKPLSWAIPLEIDDTFPIKKFTDSSQIVNVVKAFGKKINLQTQLIVTYQTITFDEMD